MNSICGKYVNVVKTRHSKNKELIFQASGYHYIIFETISKLIWLQHCRGTSAVQLTFQNFPGLPRLCHSKLSVPKNATHFTYNTILTDLVCLSSCDLKMHQFEVMSALRCSQRKKDGQRILVIS